MKKLSIYQVQTIGKALAIYSETLIQRASQRNWSDAELAAAIADIKETARAIGASSYVQLNPVRHYENIGSLANKETE